MKTLSINVGEVWKYENNDSYYVVGLILEIHQSGGLRNASVIILDSSSEVRTALKREHWQFPEAADYAEVVGYLRLS